MKGLSILNVYNKLNEKDAHEYVQSRGSFIVPENLTRATSLYKMFQNSQSCENLEAKG